MLKPKVLYIVYWGAAEPLGQSLVLPAVRRLAAMGADLTLMTFDKPADLNQPGVRTRIRESLAEAGVNWIPLFYHKSPKSAATAFDIAHGCVRAIAAHARSRVDVIHARTFVGGLIGLLIAPLLGAKLIYHNEGFYPDEQVDGRVWALNSAPHRVARWLEHRMYSRSDAIIALSHRAKEQIQELPEVKRTTTPVIVVPSCVDLDQFRRPETVAHAASLRPIKSAQPTQAGSVRYIAPQAIVKSRFEGIALTFVYAGSIGGRYTLDRIGRFMKVAARETHAHLRVLTRTSPALIKNILDQAGLPDSAWSLESVPHSQMPEQLAGSDVGLFFLTQGISEHGCSPTKIGEYWAAGLPVITTPNVSDTDEIIRRERVGVVVSEHTDEAYSRALEDLRSLLTDDQLSARCRRAAEIHYALEPACERQMSLYQNLLSADYPARAAERKALTHLRNDELRQTAVRHLQ